MLTWGRGCGIITERPRERVGNGRETYQIRQTPEGHRDLENDTETETKNDS